MQLQIAESVISQSFACPGCHGSFVAPPSQSAVIAPSAGQQNNSLPQTVSRFRRSWFRLGILHSAGVFAFLGLALVATQWLGLDRRPKPPVEAGPKAATEFDWQVVGMMGTIVGIVFGLGTATVVTWRYGPQMVVKEEAFGNWRKTTVVKHFASNADRDEYNRMQFLSFFGGFVVAFGVTLVVSIAIVVSSRN